MLVDANDRTGQFWRVRHRASENRNLWSELVAVEPRRDPGGAGSNSAQEPRRGDIRGTYGVRLRAVGRARTEPTLTASTMMK